MEICSEVHEMIPADRRELRLNIYGSMALEGYCQVEQDMLQP